jgi:hypothetical protein
MIDHDSWEKVGSRSGWMPSYHPVDEGRYENAEGRWMVKDLIRAAKSLPVYDMHVDKLVEINNSLETSEGMFGELVENPSVKFMGRVKNADRKFPILVNHDGYIIDGSHRLAGARLAGEECIKGKIMYPEDFPAMEKEAVADEDDEDITLDEAFILQRDRLLDRLRLHGLTEEEIKRVDVDAVTRRRMEGLGDPGGKNRLQKPKNKK